MDQQIACTYKAVADDGRLVCHKIGRGDKEVTPRLCAACPAAKCNCASLRFSLEKEGYGAVIIRYGNGKTAIWDDRPDGLRFARAACAVRGVPVCSASDCTACGQRTGFFAAAVATEARPMPQPCLAGSEPRGPSAGKVIPFRLPANSERVAIS
jgi:hypothetical protein